MRRPLVLVVTALVAAALTQAPAAWATCYVTEVGLAGEATAVRFCPTQDFEG